MKFMKDLNIPFSSILVTLILGLMTGVGCTKMEDSLGLPSSEEGSSAPSNKGTPAEEALVNSIVDEIQNIAQKIGVKEDFHALPIIISDEDPAISKRWAYCSWTGDHEGEYIVLNKSLFAEKQEPHKLSTLFGVILHEIGHCYFKRSHEEKVAKKNNILFRIDFEDPMEAPLYLEEFPVTVMDVHAEGGKSNLSQLPSRLKKYYVAEVMGLTRINEPEDARVLPGVSLVTQQDHFPWEPQ